MQAGQEKLPKVLALFFPHTGFCASLVLVTPILIWDLASFLLETLSTILSKIDRRRKRKSEFNDGDVDVSKFCYVTQPIALPLTTLAQNRNLIKDYTNAMYACQTGQVITN